MVFERVFLGYLANSTAGHANGKGVRRNIPCNDAACADNAALAYGNAAANGNVAGYPAVAADGDGLGVLFVGECAVRFFVLISVLPAKWVHGREDRNVGPEEHVVADGDGTAVNAGKVEVCVHIFTHFGKATVVELYRSLQVDIGVYAELLDYLAAALVGLGQGVIAYAEGMGFFAQAGKLFVRGVVDLSCEHFFFFGIHLYLSVSVIICIISISKSQRKRKGLSAAHMICKKLLTNKFEWCII